MEGVIGEEIGGIHLVLGVCVLRDLRNDVLRPLCRDDGQLHLHEDSRKLVLGRLQGSVDGPCCLGAIDALQIADRCYRESVGRADAGHRIRCRCEPVVAGEEEFRLILDRLLDTLVGLRPCLKERADVGLEKTGALLVMDRCQLLAGHDEQIAFQCQARLRGLQRRKRRGGKVM